MRKSDFGIIGLGTMGRNLLLNIVEKGFSGAGFDPDADQRIALSQSASGLPVTVAENLEGFIDSLEKPRRILLLVPAPKVTDLLGELVESLDEGDVVVDCGNSFFKETERNHAFAAQKGIRFFGAGVSGGEKGARHGASVMVGGEKDDYKSIEGILVGASAKVDGKDCCAFIGPRGAGHFVKMVHNGIEYALMQSIAETYDLLRKGLGYSNEQVADIFEDWNRGTLGSFLVEISAGILRKKDAETGRDLVDFISDVAGQKGTGMWTSTTAMEFGVPIPSIDSAVAMRQISSNKKLRTRLGGKIRLENSVCGSESPAIEQIESMLIVAFLSSYAQGFALMKTVSDEEGYAIDLNTVASIWRGGCIIRATILQKIMDAFENSGSIHMFEDDFIAKTIVSHIESARAVTSWSILKGIPFLTSSASLGYVEAISSPDLPTNLVQAQRDHFGAHTYRRTDREGVFHTADWVD